MTDLVVSGISSSALSRGVKSGKYIKICSGIYVTREPTAQELIRLLLHRYPGARITGPTAAQLYLGQQLTKPVYIAHLNPLPRSPYFKATRTRRLAAVMQKSFAVHIPCLAAELLDDTTALELLETFYARRDGQTYLERHNAGSRISPRVRDLIARAAIGTDSDAERRLTRALKQAGLQVRNNVCLGSYYWDIFIPELNVLVEVDGYTYHNSDNRLTFTKDRWKGNDAVLAGYILLRYSGSCIAYELRRVVKQMLSARQLPVSMPTTGVWTWHWLFVREANPDFDINFSS